ncbi:MAG: glutaredoxin 3 [Gammaproteobacteria bacterium]|jgi:glutaredoxin 3
MKDVTIYTTMTCPYCYRAKSLFKKLSVPYKEISVDFKPSLRADMAEKAGRTSVPQIWIAEKHIGGCDDLYALYEEGSLEKMLSY